MDDNKIWESALASIKLSISKANFNTWFRDIGLKEMDKKNNIAVIAVPSEFIKKWLSEKFDSLILKHIIRLKPEIRGIKYVVEKINNNNNSITKYQQNNQSVKKRNINKPIQQANTLNLTLRNSTTNLNKRYKFDNFVVGSFNEVAYAASQAVIKNDEPIYNPLLIYGNTGYGKTHLIQAIGNYFSTQTNKKIFYTTSEKFYMDVIDFIGLKSNKTNNFKKKYREYDVFIMDDIQFLTKKERTQEELFHLFNFLYDNNKQIILSSDKHPNQISDLEDRLKSRFNAGMIVDIQTPDYESRIEILKQKSQERSFVLSDKIIEFLATEVSGNIRELEGVLNTIYIQTEIKKRVLTLTEIKSIIQLSYKSKKNIDYQHLVEIVSDYFNIDSKNVYKKIRKREFVLPRQIIMYLLREDFNFSYPSIGEKLGGRDHTTVMHSYDKISRELKTNPEIVRYLNDLRSLY